MPDVCRAYEAYEAYEVWKGLFLTPSTARELLPPSADGPPPSKREVWGLRRSRPSALPSIAYRGFAVAPITLRAPSRRFLYNSGCRVETLLVLMGVMGFLGDLRGRNSKSPPNPLGLAERRSLLPPSADGPPPSKREVLGFRRSRPTALPSIGYRGFAVAPMTLRAPSRKIAVITSGTNGRAMRAPTGDGGATDGCKYI